MLARWQEFVGTGEWMRALQGQVSRLRDRMVSAVTGRPTRVDDLQGALESSVERLLRAEADRAAERTVTAWRSLPAGAELLAGREQELERVSPDFPDAAAAQVRDWQGAVLDLVRSEGADKRSRARVLSWGVNGAGAVVMVAVFAQTGGLTGGEIAVAGGTTALGQRLLEAVFGDAAVRSLAARAREDLEARADHLLRYEQERFDVLVAAAAPGRGAADELRATVGQARGGPSDRGMSRREIPLADRLAALREAVEVAEGRLAVPEVARARALLAKAGARAALGDATVVALAGATGSGKSTLFNALSGGEISTPGVRRPTTGVAHATTWGDEDADKLLDWLEVPRRHRHAPEPALDGLVLLDLPDHDSVRLEHRLEVDRLVGLVDVLVWVLDPEKYADAAVHERYLVPLASHAGVLLVVLNQVDRLEPAAAAACLADLRGLLDREGLAATPLLAASARTGRGVSELRGELARRVAARRAATERLAADVRGAAAELAPFCPAGGSGPGRRDRAALLDDLGGALADAAGVPTVITAVERSTLRDGVARTGWPLLRWTRKLRADPLARLHLGDERARTSLPPAGAVELAGVATAVRRAREAAGEDLPQAWRDDLRSTVEDAEERLPDRLDAAVAGADLGPDRVPLWQRAVGGLQWLLAVTALVGVLWLLVLFGLGFFQVDDVVPLPRVQGVPLPTLLLAGGLLAGLLLALVTRPLVRLRARRRGRAAERRLRAAIDAVADDALLGPMAAVRRDADRFRAAVTAAGR